VILGPEFSLNGSGRLRFVKPQTTLRALRAGIRLHDDWQDIYAALHEWNDIWRLYENLKTRNKFRNLPDIIVTSGSEVIKEYYCITKFYSHQLMHFLIQPCISLLSYIKIT
jgi:hypothetical protein